MREEARQCGGMDGRSTPRKKERRKERREEAGQGGERERGSATPKEPRGRECITKRGERLCSPMTKCSYDINYC